MDWNPPDFSDGQTEGRSQAKGQICFFKHNIPSRLLLLYTFYQEEKEGKSGKEMEKEEEGRIYPPPPLAVKIQFASFPLFLFCHNWHVPLFSVSFHLK